MFRVALVCIMYLCGYKSGNNGKSAQASAAGLRLKGFTEILRTHILALLHICDRKLHSQIKSRNHSTQQLFEHEGEIIRQRISYDLQSKNKKNMAALIICRVGALLKPRGVKSSSVVWLGYTRAQEKWNWSR